MIFLIKIFNILEIETDLAAILEIYQLYKKAVD